MNLSIVMEYQCAFCGEENKVEVDRSAGRKQTFTEDCAVCCRPNLISCVIDDQGNVGLDIKPEE